MVLINHLFDWQHIKTEWHKYWDTSKPILLEKSPHSLARANDIEANFTPSYFIVSVREPYTLFRRQLMDIDKYHPSEQKNIIIKQAKRNIKILRYQKRNLETLKNVLFITYETLTNDPKTTKEKLIQFLPELTDIDMSITITRKAPTIRGSNLKLTNLNPYQIALLKQSHLDIINYVYEKNVDILSYFNYQIRTEPLVLT